MLGLTLPARPCLGPALWSRTFPAFLVKLGLAEEAKMTYPKGRVNLLKLGGKMYREMSFFLSLTQYLLGYLALALDTTSVWRCRTSSGGWYHHWCHDASKWFNGTDSIPESRTWVSQSSRSLIGWEKMSLHDLFSLPNHSIYSVFMTSIIIMSLPSPSWPTTWLVSISFWVLIVAFAILTSTRGLLCSPRA